MIHTLHRQGHSIRAISRITGIDRRTISKRLKEDEIKPYKTRTYPSKLDAFKEYINKRLLLALPYKIPSTVILDEIESRGYKGKIRILQAYMRRWYEENQISTRKEEKIIRFETKPGFQAQVDWTTIRKGTNPIYGFVMILSYSRAPFVYFTDSMTQDIWQDCHTKAFSYFGGVPKTILYDNLKSAVIERNKYGQNRHGFNQEFLDFSKGWFIPKICKPYRPQTKGKVERFNRYLKENFYRPLFASLKGSGFEITVDLLNSFIFGWIEKTNERIHGTTNQKPKDRLNKERQYLTPYIPPAKEVCKKKEKDIVSNIPNIDISYYTKLNDYEIDLLKGADYDS